MEQTAFFSVSKSKLLPALKQLMRFEKASKKKKYTLEITITDGSLQLVIPGVSLTVAAETSGSAKLTVGLAYMTEVINSQTNNVIAVSLTPNRVTIEHLSFGAPAIFFETDRVLRSINLPINYTYLDIAKLYLSDKYTEEEIQFNNLRDEVETAMKQVDADIMKITAIARTYGISKKDVEAMLFNRLKTHSN